MNAHLHFKNWNVKDVFFLHFNFLNVDILFARFLHFQDIPKVQQVVYPNQSIMLDIISHFNTDGENQTRHITHIELNKIQIFDRTVLIKLLKY